MYRFLQLNNLLSVAPSGSVNAIIMPPSYHSLSMHKPFSIFIQFQALIYADYFYVLPVFSMIAMYFIWYFFLQLFFFIIYLSII